MRCDVMCCDVIMATVAASETNLLPVGRCLEFLLGSLAAERVEHLVQHNIQLVVIEDIIGVCKIGVGNIKHVKGGANPKATSLSQTLLLTYPFEDKIV